MRLFLAGLMLAGLIGCGEPAKPTTPPKDPPKTTTEVKGATDKAAADAKAAADKAAADAKAAADKATK